MLKTKGKRRPNPRQDCRLAMAQKRPTSLASRPRIRHLPSGTASSPRPNAGGRWLGAQPRLLEVDVIAAGPTGEFWWWCSRENADKFAILSSVDLSAREFITGASSGVEPGEVIMAGPSLVSANNPQGVDDTGEVAQDSQEDVN
jgi:hypothetical protein